MAYLTNEFLSKSYDQLAKGWSTKKLDKAWIAEDEYVAIGQLIYVQTRNKFRANLIKECAKFSTNGNGQIRIGMIPVAKRNDLKRKMSDKSAIPIYGEDFATEDLSGASSGSENITFGLIRKLVEKPVEGTTCHLVNDHFFTMQHRENRSEIVVIADCSASGRQCMEFMESMKCSESVTKFEAAADTKISLFVSCISRQAIGLISNHSRKWGYKFSFNTVVPTLKHHPFPKAWARRMAHWVNANISPNAYQQAAVLYVSEFSVPNNLPPIFIGKGKKLRDALFSKRSDTRIIDWDEVLMKGEAITTSHVRRIFGERSRLRSTIAQKWFELSHWSMEMDILALCSRQRTLIDLMELTSIDRDTAIDLLQRLTKAGYLCRTYRPNIPYRREVWRCTDAGAYLLASLIRRRDKPSGTRLHASSDRGSIEVLLKK